MAYALGERVATYKVLTGIDLPDKRVEAGDTVSETDIPKRSLKWLVDQSVIEKVDSAPAPAPAKKVAKKVAEPEPWSFDDDSGDDL
jgi:hypothetical protein